MKLTENSCAAVQNYLGQRKICSSFLGLKWAALRVSPCNQYGRFQVELELSVRVGFTGEVLLCYSTVEFLVVVVCEVSQGNMASLNYCRLYCTM